MVQSDYIGRNQEAIGIAHEIWSARAYTFKDLVPSMLEEVAGVYLIAKMENDKVLYVGRTTNIRRRLYTNQLQGNQSTARFKKYLVEDNACLDIATMEDAKQWLREHCYFKFIKRNDFRERGQIEGVLSYLFDVQYIDKEH